MTQPVESVYRSEAMRQLRWRGAEGQLLKTTSAPIRHSYRFIMALVCVCAAFIVFGSLDRYSSGPMVVRVAGRTELTALHAATVARVFVKPGQLVEAGELLMGFHTEALEAELARYRSEYEDRVRARLRDTRDEASREAIVSLRAALDLATRRLDELTVRAPQSGIVTDVRSHPGQAVVEGDALVTLSTDTAHARVVAMLPAHDRPLLHVGAPLRLDLAGYRYAYRHAEVTSVGEEAVGPAEVRRFLGPELADTVQVSGPVVLVEAQLSAPIFEVDGQTLHYLDGMLGRADVLLRRERVMVMLIPALRVLWGEAS